MSDVERLATDMRQEAHTLDRAACAACPHCGGPLKGGDPEYLAWYMHRPGCPFLGVSAAPVSCVPTCPVRDAAKWVLNCAYGLGKSGGNPQVGEYEAATTSLSMALAHPCLGPPAVPSEAGSDRPKIVCLCGSSRFVAEMASIAWALERDEGYIVLGLHLLPANHPGLQPDHQAEADGKKEHFDKLHLHKIDLADRVLVVNIGGYIGESTRREIAYALSLGKPVRYLEPVATERGAPPPEEP